MRSLGFLLQAKLVVSTWSQAIKKAAMRQSIVLSPPVSTRSTCQEVGLTVRSESSHGFIIMHCILFRMSRYQHSPDQGKYTFINQHVVKHGGCVFTSEITIVLII